MDVLDFLHVHELPLTMEAVLEVTHRSWLVKLPDDQTTGQESEQSDNLNEGKI